MKGVKSEPDPSASIGPLSGIGGLYAGHAALDGAPVEASVDVANVEGITLVASAWTGEEPASSSNGLATPFALLANADAVLETLHWPAAARHRGHL